MSRIPPLGKGWLVIAAMAAPFVLKAAKPIAKNVGKGMRKFSEMMNNAADRADKAGAEFEAEVEENLEKQTKKAEKPEKKAAEKPKPKKAAPKKTAAAKPKVSKKPTAKAKAKPAAKAKPKATGKAKPKGARPGSAPKEATAAPPKTEPNEDTPSTSGRRRPPSDVETG